MCRTSKFFISVLTGQKEAYTLLLNHIGLFSIKRDPF